MLPRGHVPWLANPPRCTSVVQSLWPSSAFHDRLAFCDKKARLTNWTRRRPLVDEQCWPYAHLSSICLPPAGPFLPLRRRDCWQRTPIGLARPSPIGLVQRTSVIVRIPQETDQTPALYVSPSYGRRTLIDWLKSSHQRLQRQLGFNKYIYTQLITYSCFKLHLLNTGRQQKWIIKNSKTSSNYSIQKKSELMLMRRATASV